ncbi:MAG: Crp/Fnr family transcriptional regulator [Candidatus Binataceae bacterium]
MNKCFYTNGRKETPGDQILKARLIRFGLSAEMAHELIAHHTVQNYSKSAIVFLEGSPAEVVYWVGRGLVDVYSSTDDGGRILIQLAGPGDLIGYVDYSDEQGRRCQAFEAHTRTHCQLNLVARERIHLVLRELDAESLLRLMAQFSGAWSAEVRRWTRFVGLDFRQRLKFVLEDLATRYGVADDRGVLLIPELSHLDFAEMIGCSRPMMSKLLSELIEERLLAQNGKRYIIRRGLSLARSNSQALPMRRRQESRRGSGAVREAPDAEDALISSSQIARGSTL